MPQDERDKMPLSLLSPEDLLEIEAGVDEVIEESLTQVDAVYLYAPAGAERRCPTTKSSSLGRSPPRCVFGRSLA